MHGEIAARRDGQAGALGMAAAERVHVERVRHQ
jgi:hypothetical protein